MRIFLANLLSWYFMTTVVSSTVPYDESSLVIDPEHEIAPYEDTNDITRTRRHGDDKSSDSNLKSILGSFFNKKLGLLGSLSSSSSSKKFETHHHTYEEEHTTSPPKIDWLGLKKSVLSSLFQAVKAITGGFLALNGQLVKVKGHIMTAKGQLLATKGDKISNFGRHIAVNAFGPPHSQHDDSHESVPSSPSASGPSGYGASLEYEYTEPYKHSFSYPMGYYKGMTGYAKRAAPYYYSYFNAEESPVEYH